MNKNAMIRSSNFLSSSEVFWSLFFQHWHDYFVLGDRHGHRRLHRAYIRDTQETSLTDKTDGNPDSHAMLQPLFRSLLHRRRNLRSQVSKHVSVTAQLILSYPAIDRQILRNILLL